MRISIVTVTWNSAATLRDTIESVLKQDYPNLEYIIADGLSKDETVNIIKEYEPKFNGRMKWFSEKDKGMYDAMNKGIKMATGDVVGIINSDDFFHRTDVISKVAEAFEQDKSIEVVYGDVRFVNDGDLDKTVRYYSSKNFALWRFRFGFMPAHPSFYTYKHNFAGTDTVQNEKSGMAVRSEGGATLMVGGKVLYRSSNTELKDDSTVSLPETGTAYVIFKR